MDFTFDTRTEELRAQLLAYMDEAGYPAEHAFRDQFERLDDPWAWSTVPVLQDLRRDARSRGLCNLFLSGQHGAGLTNLQYAPLAAITGRSSIAPAALNSSAPDTANMELLSMFGLSQDFPLAESFAQVRALRFADGPDEVHKNALARRELKLQTLRHEAPSAAQTNERV